MASTLLMRTRVNCGRDRAPRSGGLRRRRGAITTPGTRCSVQRGSVRKIRDVFGDNHVDRADLVLLGVERLVEAGPETGYHHLFDGLGIVRGSGRATILGADSAGQAHQRSGHCKFDSPGNFGIFPEDLLRIGHGSPLQMRPRRSDATKCAVL